MRLYWAITNTNAQNFTFHFAKFILPNALISPLLHGNIIKTRSRYSYIYFVNIMNEKNEFLLIYSTQNKQWFLFELIKISLWFH